MGGSTALTDMNEARREGAEMNEHIIMQGTTSPFLPHSLCLFPSITELA